ncbi:hypothetical protein P4S65_16595 [Pseudoalteromonas sp. B131b]|uniref:hypothetical protein n=1 Tax=Pseudoalteromonas sp. B131b TaxID=630493 RepID=UPI00301C086C
MDHKVKGSWLIHHTNKLQNMNSQGAYQNTFVAGKAGILLSAISESQETVVSNDKLEILASAANINIGFELPILKNVLAEHELIDLSESGVGVLGITTSSALQHTSNIFESLNPKAIESSALDLAETVSIKPFSSNELSEEISDKYKLARAEVTQLFHDSEQIGFVDVENINANEKVLFNGNLFRRDSATKIKSVLDSLNTVEQSSLNELTLMLKRNSCVSCNDASRILGTTLFNKVNSIGFFDINVVSNHQEEVGFLTLPSAFSKFSNSMVDDAFDLAKAFVASLTYGMTKSDHARGQISMIDKLLGALIDGREVGPVKAIGQDYKMLELKGVVSIRIGMKNGRHGPIMRLLKKKLVSSLFKQLDRVM